MKRSYTIRRNIKLKEWIESTWADEYDRAIAWETFAKILELHPEQADALRGEIIDKETKEI